MVELKEIIKEQDKKLGDQQVKYIFCLPGHPSSGIQEMGVVKVLLDFIQMGIPFGIAHAESSNIYAVRNACLSKRRFRKDQKPFEGDPRYETYERMIWIDSDNIVNTRQVLQLLSHDVDIVAAWYRQYNGIQPLNDQNKTACGLWKIADGYSKIHPFLVNEIPTIPVNEKGLFPVDYSGMGLFVNKRGVFESLGYPWFRSGLLEWREDVFDKDGNVVEKDVEMCDIETDDGSFCFRVKEKGFQVFVDPKVRVLHERRIGV